MKINHSAIRSVIRFVVLTAFVSSLMWRIYNIMKFGGKVEKTDPNDVDRDDDDTCECECDCEAQPVSAKGID